MASLKGIQTKTSSVLSKIADRADMIGAVIGYFGTFATAAAAETPPGETTNYFTMLIGRHYNAVKIHNFAGLGDLPNRLVNDPNWGGVTLTGVAMTIGGIIADQLPSMAPLQKPVTRLVKKAGIGIVIGGLAALVVSEISQGSGGWTVEGGTGTSSSRSRTVTTSGRVSPVLGDFQTVSPRTSSLTAPMK